MGSSEPSQGSWAYLGSRKITPPGVVALHSTMRGQEKKMGFTDFGLYALVHRELSCSLECLFRKDYNFLCQTTIQSFGKCHLMKFTAIDIRPYYYLD